VCGRREKWAKEKGASLALEIIKKVNQAGQSGAVSLRACMDIVCGGVYFCWPFRQINSQAANTHTHTHKTISPEHYACIASISFLYKVAVTKNRGGGPSYIYGRPRRAKYTNTTTACECDVYYALLFLVRFQGPERNKVRSRRCTK
jgi:hypothetical protein